MGDIDPKDVYAQMGLARSLAAIGQYKQATETLEKVLAKREHTGALRELGKIYLVDNQPDKCIDAYSRVIHKDASNIPALNGMGVCYDIKGNHKEAQALYQRALALAPDHWGVKSNMGLSLVLEGKYDTGVKLLASAANRPDATPKDRQNYAIALGLTGDLEQAAQFLSIDLTNTDVRKNLAMFHIYKQAESAPKTLALSEIAPSHTPEQTADAAAAAPEIAIPDQLVLQDIPETPNPEEVDPATAVDLGASSSNQMAQLTTVY